MREAVANAMAPPYTIPMPHSASQVLQFCLFFPVSSAHAWITHLRLDDRRKDISDLYFLQRARWDANDDEIVNTDMLLENIPE